MRNCAVTNCTNNSGKPSSVANRVSFHHFPKDPETRQAWIYATGRINWTPRSYSTICSEHFTEYDFTMKNGKKFLRSTTVPRFNLNEQNSLYTESQYHNETQAALEFLTGQIFPESKVPEQQEAEVVTVKVIGGNNAKVVVRKPVTESPKKPDAPQKKPKYFSLVNCFKSEEELKAERDKIHELIRDNLDPTTSQILLSLSEKPIKKKKKTNGENSIKQGKDQPRSKNGQFLKLPKMSSIQSTTASSEGHYTDTLTREEIIHKLKQRDEKISQQQMTIKKLQKTHLKDQVVIESLRIKLELKNNVTVDEPINESVAQTPQLNYQDSRNQYGFKKPARHQIVAQKRQRLKTTSTEKHYQSNRNFADQDEAIDNQNRHPEVALKKPARKQIVTQKRQRLETSNTENHDESNRHFSEQDQTYFDTQNRQSEVALKKSARQKIVKQKRQRLETTNTEKHKSNRNFSDEYQAYCETQNRHSDVGLKKPAGQRIVIQSQEILVASDTVNCNQSNMIFSDQDRTHFWNF